MVQNLTAEETSALQEGFDDRAMFEIGRSNVGDAETPVGGMLDWLGTTAYNAEHLDPVTRERVLIALFAGRGSERPLRIHIYWSLMLGISSDEILCIFGLVAGYSGVDSYLSSSGALARVVEVLKAKVATRQCAMTEVLSALL